MSSSGKVKEKIKNPLSVQPISFKSVSSMYSKKKPKDELNDEFTEFYDSKSRLVDEFTGNLM